MAKSLRRDEDRQKSKAALEGGQSKNFLKIPEKKTPWYFLSLDYQDGHIHWADTGNGTTVVACAGDLEDNGFAPEKCPLCKLALEYYNEGKRLRKKGKIKEADELKNMGNQVRAKYQANFVAIRGERIPQKTRDGKKKYVADFDLNSKDEESSVAVGIMSLSGAQFNKLDALTDDDGVPQVKSGDDLGNRVIWTRKEKGSGRYKEVYISADEHESDPPDVEWSWEDYDITSDFEVDEDKLHKAYEFMSGQAIEDEEGDEVEEEEDDEVEEEDVDDDFLDDVEEEEEEEGDDDDVTPENFEDDDPYDEPEPPKKKPVKKTKPSTGTKKKRSGKASL